MDKQLIINMVVAQVGQEKAEEVLKMVLGLADKMGDNDIYILKRLKNKGITLISTNSNDCKMSFPNATVDNPPKMFEVEKIVRDIEI